MLIPTRHMRDAFSHISETGSNDAALMWQGRNRFLAENVAPVSIRRVDEKSYPPNVGDGHRIIDGDNLAVMRSLLTEFRGGPKTGFDAIYITPVGTPPPGAPPQDSVEALLASMAAYVHYYYLADQGGNIIMMVDGAGTIASKYSYDAYGNRTPDLNYPITYNPFGFGGNTPTRRVGWCTCGRGITTLPLSSSSPGTHW